MARNLCLNLILLCLIAILTNKGYAQDSEFSFEGSGMEENEQMPTDDEDGLSEFSGSGDEEEFVVNVEEKFTGTGRVFEEVEETIKKDIEEILENQDDDDEEEELEIDPSEDTVVAEPKSGSLFESKHFMAAVIIGGCIALVFTVAVIMLLVYRMKKKDEGSYALDDKSANFEYTKGISKEYHV